ncbi:sigma-54-dependent Fis family transcriptional regulator [Thiorhodococcus mannitoliphagus]|uniref:Sigma-54-dependent Fis family transcriptional regulator n=1 Tax=Thiorhodococcus mannitoliphagus TaxID=329406 RepID=A0A6P1DWU1_9GAMM|nr:sigma-54 dependent transcriptional regulator [Thiorhodococcus mannitoliphagus]NEX20164.1 sigma-54-dependent Fis family transcriptional regulator [Thiorhodococcus mannitoliphagus]
MSRPTVLLVDDEPLSLETLARILDEEFDVRTATNPLDAEHILEEDWIQVVISDQRMPEMTGVELLARVRERWPDMARIIISGYTEAEDIIDGINRAGIHQYITKPWHPDNLLLIVRNACRLVELQRENALLALEMKVTGQALEQRVAKQRERLKRNFNLDAIVRSPESPINQVCDQIGQIAPYDIPVLLTGESGTGKELLARALHYNSPRADKPFVAENTGAMPDQLLESELFGHEKGAFTGAVSARVGLFEQADGGTIFLDEIGEVSTAFQVKLLRVLQEQEVRPIGSNRRRKVNVRVVAATNRDLEAAIREGRFREDLYYRLAGVRVHIPPLRERPMDIRPIAEQILAEAVRDFAKPVDGFTPETLECIARYDWPGNVRELQNEIQRILVLAPGQRLSADLLDPRVLRAQHAGGPRDALNRSDALGLNGTLKDRVEALEASVLRETLIRHRWNKTQAADELGLSRVGLRSKLERYGLIPN